MRDPRIGEDASDLGGVTDADPAGEQGVADARLAVEQPSELAVERDLGAGGVAGRSQMRSHRAVPVGPIDPTPFGDTTFRFRERRGYRAFYPGAQAVAATGPSNKFGFEELDHVTSNFQTMKPMLLWLEQVMGFEQLWNIEFHTSDVDPHRTSGSGLKSIVMWDPASNVKFANNEPARPFFKASQINIFNEELRGDGVQHVALTVKDIVTAVRGMRANDVTFMPTPGSYYDMLPARNRTLLDYRWLEDHVGPLAPLEVILRVPQPPPQTASGEFMGYPMLDRVRLVKQAESIVRGVTGVERTVSAASFTPSLPPNRGRVIQRVLLNRKLSEHRADFIASGFLRETPEGDLWRVSARVRASDRPDYIRIYNELKQAVGRFVQSGDAEGVKVESVVLTGAIPIVQKSQQQVLQDLFRSFITAFWFIALAMIILLRSVAGGLVSMIPNVFPPVVVFGLLGWFGVTVEVGSMMTATVAMAIAVDDTLHYLTWFRRGLERGQTREEAVEFAYARCGVAMIQTTLICGLGLLVFVFSPFTPISRFAWLMFSMLSVALLGDLIVLPALLLSPAGRLFRPRGTAVHAGTASPLHSDPCESPPS